MILIGFLGIMFSGLIDVLGKSSGYGSSARYAAENINQFLPYLSILIIVTGIFVMVHFIPKK